MLKKGLFLMASLFAVVSCGQFQESSSQVLDLEGNIPFFEEFLSQENSQKEDSSAEKLLTQEESLQKCEEKKNQKQTLLRLCQNSFAGVGATKTCSPRCENGSWKIEEKVQFLRDL